MAAPRLFGTTTPEKVGRAVVAAIRRNAPEISVTPYPIRPFLALAALAPVTAQRLTTWVGVTAVARRVARLHGRIVEPPTQADATAGAARSPTAWPVNRDRMGGTNTMPRCRPPVTRASWNPLRLLSLDEVVGQFGGDAPAWLWPVTMATTFRTVFRAIRAAGHGRTARRGAAHLGRT